MRLTAPIKDHHREARLFVARVLLASACCLVLLGIVIARLVQLQVFDYQHFTEKSLGNRVRIEALPPNRGLIYDRKGRVLAENLPAYQLELIPEQVPDIEDTLRRLARLELIDREDIARFSELSLRGPRFKPVTLRFRMSDDEISNFALRRPRFPGVDFQPRLVRHYPHGELAAHAIGYVGALSARRPGTARPRRLRGHRAHGQDRRRNLQRGRAARRHRLSADRDQRQGPPGRRRLARPDPVTAAERIARARQ